MPWFMGIDIGSGTTKGVIVRDGIPVAYHLVPSGINYRAAGERLREDLLAMVGLAQEDVACTVVTGSYGEGFPFSCRQATDIRCCARGIHSVLPSARTVIDVQRQSSKVIRLSEKGQAVDFAVSERCASGSGYFINVVADVLKVELEDMGSLSAKSKQPATFTTGCAVFGESEVVSMVSEGIAREDIVAGIHEALANKICALIGRVGLETDCAMSGGGGLNTGLIKELEERLGVPLKVPPRPQFINALGAALLAEEATA
jgi:predicted CoA-substrate-specific enzyme activase